MKMLDRFLQQSLKWSKSSANMEVTVQRVLNKLIEMFQVTYRKEQLNFSLIVLM